MSKEEKTLMSKEVVEGDGEVKPKNSPKTSKETWLKIKVEFESGTYKSQRELALKYGVPYESFRNKICREKWNARQITLQNKVSQRIEEKTLKAVDKVQSYLSSAYERGLRYEKLIDASQSQAATNNEGVAILDVEELEAYSRTEIRIHELIKSSLRVAPPSLEVRSGGLSIGESIVTALEKLRASGSTLELPEGLVERVIEMEIIPDPK